VVKVLERSTKLFFFLFLLVFPFGQLAKLPLSFLPVEVGLSLGDIFLFLTITTWLVWHKLKMEKIKLPSLSTPLLTFFSLASFSLLINSPSLSFREALVSSLYLWRWLFYIALYFFVFNFGSRAKNHFLSLKNLVGTLAVLGTILALFGLIQYLLWPDLRSLEVIHWDPHYFRVVSTLLDPGFTGLIFVFTLSLIMALYFNTQNKSKRKTWFWIGLVVYASLSLTYSRSSYLAYLVAAATVAAFKKSLKFFLIALLVLLVTLPLLPRPGGEGVKLERWASIEARLRSWQNSLTIFRRSPFFGVGFNSYRYAQRDFGFLENDWQENHAGAGADSSLLLVLATTGLAGFAAYFWLWVKAFNLVLSKIKKGISQNFSLAILASLGALWTHSLFLNSQFYPWVLSWVWILIAGLEGTKNKSL
jgi:O-antigen ligase